MIFPKKEMPTFKEMIGNYIAILKSGRQRTGTAVIILHFQEKALLGKKEVRSVSL